MTTARDELLNLIDALRAYAQHEPMCKAYRYPGLGACQCGLRDVLAQASSATAEGGAEASGSTNHKGPNDQREE